MGATTIKTVTETWFPSPGQTDQIITMSKRLLVNFQSHGYEPNAASTAKVSLERTEQEIFSAIFATWGTYTRHVPGSATIDIHGEFEESTPVLTEKQRRSIALVKEWMSESKNEQTEALGRFMISIDEDREGFRTLYK